VIDTDFTIHAATPHRHAQTVQRVSVDSLELVGPNSMQGMARAHRHRRSPTVGRALPLVLAAVMALAALGAITAVPAPAHAEDRVAALGRMLGSSSEKVRLSAVLALAKLGEPRVGAPLIRALRDKSPRVRTVAAAALGQLDCSAALPTLRELARNDEDPDVRNAASAATMKIISAGHSERGHPADRAGDVEQARRPAPGGARLAHAFTAEPHPELYVLVKSSTDDSPGTSDAATRKQHAEILRRALLDRLRGDPAITSVAGEARRWSLDARYLDVSVTRLAATRIGDVIEVGAELRIAISDDSGKMLSLLSGGAKAQVPATGFDARTLPALRRDALDGAMRGMFDKLFAQLRESP
jgi:hypothetical protein